jgi:hypothetical protein
VTVAARREAVQLLVARGLSQRRACVLLQLQRSTFGYQARPESNTELTTQVAELARHAMIPVQASHPGHVWTYAFLHDRCLNGTPLKVLTVMDEFTREGLAIEAATWLEGHHWGVEIWHIRIGMVRSPGLEEGPSGSSPGQEGCAYRR